jgi:hypothetical protein
MRTLAIAALLALSVTACSSAPHSTGPSLQRNVITLAEIQSATVPTANLWDFIATARPHFLRDRGVGSFRDTTPVRALVYLDGSMLGDVQVLKSISLSSVKLIQYMSGADATTRYGMGHSGGVILLSTH